MSAPLSPEELAERCMCQATPVADRTEAEHAVWCPSRKPTTERLAEIKAGTGRPLMAGELEWLRGDAGRAELHISGAAAGAFPLSDNLPDWIAELGRKLGAVVAELDRTRTQLEQSENDLTGARLSLWEEEQDTRRMRLALEAAKRGRRQQRARVAELEAERDERPSRFSATPLQVDVHLRSILAEDTYLRYQQTIGGLAVEEATKDIRMETASLKAHGVLELDKDWAASSAADHVDPLKGGGPYPSQLLCSQHHGFGSCPGAPWCTPSQGGTEAGGSR